MMFVAKLCSLFCFSFKELSKLKGQDIHIILDIDSLFSNDFIG